MFEIVTDSAANLKYDFAQRNNITVIPFPYFIDEEEHDCVDPEAFDAQEYYECLRQGQIVTTSQITPQRYVESIEPILSDGKDVLFIGLSSSVSGSVSSAMIASKQLKERYPGRRMVVVDSIGASLGEGLLPMKALELKQQGMDIDSTADYLNEMKKHICQIFTVDDLKHLRRTGRLSKLETLIGSVLHIKPILKGDDKGRIVCFAKVRGRNRSIRELADRCCAFIERPEEQVIGISHACCIEDAELLKGLISERITPKGFLTVTHEPATGSHVGPGMLAVYFLGDINFRTEA